MLNPNPRGILAFKDLAVNTPEMQRLALFFDHIFLWMPYANKELSLDDQTYMEKEIEYLRSEGVVAAVGHEIPPMPFMPVFGNEEGDCALDINEMIKKDLDNLDFCLPLLTRDPNAPPISEEMYRWELLRTHALGFVSNRDLHSTPVSVYCDPNQIPQSGSSASQALLLTIENFVMPPENMPWQDLLQFRLEEENQTLIRNFRRWLSKVSSAEESPSAIVEELQHLLDEYKKYMSIQHNKYSLAKLGITLTAAPVVFTGSFLPAAGALIAAGIGLRRQRIALEEAELSAPGREVSYLIKIQNDSK